MVNFLDKPMKAADFEEMELKFPYVGSVKLDGYRGLLPSQKIWTARHQPVLNNH